MNKKPTYDAQRRRLEDTLVVIGTGVVAFGAWTLLKTVLLWVLYGNDVQRMLIDAGTDLPTIVLYIFSLIPLVFDLALRLFVGFSARAEGNGRHKGPVYLGVAALFALSSALSVGSAAWLLLAWEADLIDTVITIVIEATQLALLVQLIVCSVRLRRMNKEDGQAM